LVELSNRDFKKLGVLGAQGSHQYRYIGYVPANTRIDVWRLL